MRYLRFLYASAFSIFALYFLLAVLFYAPGTDIFSVAMAPGDGFIQGVPTKIFSSSLSLWNPYVQTGTFAIKDIGNQAAYLPGLLVMMLFPDEFGYNILLLLHYAAAGFFTFLFLRQLKSGVTASFIGGLCFMFSGFLTAHKGHHSMMNAAVWMPLVLYFWELYFNSRKVLFLFLSSAAFAFSILADYPAVSMYSAMVVAPYIFTRCLCAEQPGPGSKLSAAKQIFFSCLVIFSGGVLLSAVEILPVMESLKFVTRENITYEFFSGYSFPLYSVPLLFFPFLFGTHYPGFYGSAYFGPWNLTEMAGYMGILPLFIALLTFILWRRKNHQVWFWTIVAAAGFLLVLGSTTPFYRLTFYIPVYNMFRVPARNWYEVNFAVAILAAIGIDRIISMEETFVPLLRRHARRLAVALAVLTLVVISGAFIAPKLVFLSGAVKDGSSVMNDFGVTIERACGMLSENLRPDSTAVLVPLIIIILTAYFLFKIHVFYSKRTFWRLAAVFIFIDLFSFGHFHDNYYRNSYLIGAKEKNEVYKFLSKNENDMDNFRVLPLENNTEALSPNLNLVAGVKTVNGYGPIWLKDYKSLTGFEANGISGSITSLIRQSRILSVLSAKYILTADPALKGLMNSIVVNPDNSAGRLIIDGFSSNSWYFYSPYSAGENEVILQSANGRDVSLIQRYFNLEENAKYRVTFEAKAVTAVTSPLVVDFFTDADYDSPEREKKISTALTGDFKSYSVIFDSGYNCPAGTNLRFFSWTTNPVIIRNVSLQKMDTETLFWGQLPSGSSASALYQKRFETRTGISVYENLNFLPRARFVSEVLAVSGFESAKAILMNDLDFNPMHTALAEEFPGTVSISSGNIISEDFSKNDSLEFAVVTGENAFFVISDAFYPGWKAYIDGYERPVYKTNGTAMGVLIQGAGKHQVRLVFKPWSFYLGLIVTIETIFVMALAILLLKKSW